MIQTSINGEILLISFINDPINRGAVERDSFFWCYDCSKSNSVSVKTMVFNKLEEPTHARF